MKSFRFLTTCLILAIALSGCALFKKKGAGNYTGVDGDYVSGTPLPDRQEGASFLSGNVDKTQFPPIYFGYDSYSVSGAEAAKLDEVASRVSGGGQSVIIAGFTDERGTEEYNRGLGEKRALSVREGLLQRGCDPSKLQTVSFGEEMPADSGGGESAWAKNRRAEFGLVR
jgi:peptidoglycan-associated lipoprotein